MVVYGSARCPARCRPSGRVKNASGDGLTIRQARDGKEVTLKLEPRTGVQMNGQCVSGDDLPEGAEARMVNAPVGNQNVGDHVRVIQAGQNSGDNANEKGERGTPNAPSHPWNDQQKSGAEGPARSAAG